MTQRYVIESSIEVPLIVDAADWQAAWAIGLDLLERAERSDLMEIWVAAGCVFARDPFTAETFSVYAAAVAEAAA